MINLERKHQLERRREEQELKQKISAKMEAISALEKSLNNLKLNGAQCYPSQPSTDMSGQSQVQSSYCLVPGMVPSNCLNIPSSQLRQLQVRSSQPKQVLMSDSQSSKMLSMLGCTQTRSVPTMQQSVYSQRPQGHSPVYSLVAAANTSTASSALSHSQTLSAPQRMSESTSQVPAVHKRLPHIYSQPQPVSRKLPAIHKNLPAIHKRLPHIYSQPQPVSRKLP